MNKKRALYLVFIIIIIIFIVFLYNNKKESIFGNSENKYEFELLGKKIEIVYIGEKYIEKGFWSIDSKRKNLANEVTIEGFVNNNIIGKYELIYKLRETSIKRIVYVINKTQSFPYIELLGDKKMYIKSGSTFVDPGYLSVDDVDDLADKTNIYGEVNTNKEGEYTILYSVLDNNGNKFNTERTVVVCAQYIDLNISNKELTKNSININAVISVDKYDYAVLPNGTKITDNYFDYEVSENGIYEFTAFDKNGLKYINKIEIKNIDNSPPIGACTLKVKEKMSIIELSFMDSLSGIKNYRYLDKDYLGNIIEIYERLSSARVSVYDNLGNETTVDCNVEVLELPMYGFILIGDSRFELMTGHIKDIITPNNIIVAKSGEGYDWFVSDAIPKVDAILKNNPAKRYYIYSNLGINDYYGRDGYANKLNELANGKWAIHKVGYISINPYAGSNPKNKYINIFNLNQKSQLKNVYYCDTYNGIGKNNFIGRTSSDTLHYAEKTSREIYNYIVNKCNF